MYQFFESIRIVNGRVMNLSFHQKRVNRTFQQGHLIPLSLKTIIPRDSIPKKGVYKLRISYSIKEKNTWDIIVENYTEKPISSLQLIHCNDLEYAFKSEDRNLLDEAYAQKDRQVDDIVFVLNNQLTDTWYCNIALWNGEQWHTPKNCLLQGTMREKLLKSKVIYALNIEINDLSKYSKVRLFNAMIPWSNRKEIPLKNIYLSL